MMTLGFIVIVIFIVAWFKDQIDDQRRCRVRHAYLGRCTRRPGHIGRHMNRNGRPFGPYL